MKILVISQYYDPEPFKIHEICRELVRKKHSVTVLTSRPNYPRGDVYEGYEDGSRDYEVFQGVDIHRLCIKPRKQGSKHLLINYISFMNKACVAIDKMDGDYDAVLVYQLSPVFMILPGLKYKKKYGVPLITYCLDLWPESIRVLNETLYKISRPILLPFCRYLYRNCDTIGVTSPSFSTYFKNTIKVNEEKVKFIPQHGEDIFLQVKDYCNEKTIITYAGNLGKAQDFDTLIKAVECLILEKETCPFQIWLIGDGSQKNELQDRIRDQELDKYFKFVDKVDKEKLIHYYELSSALFLTLRNNSMIGSTIPTKLQSYMAAGRMILGNCEGDAAKLISAEKCGLVNIPGDALKLKENLMFILNNHEKCRTFGVTARAYYEKKYTINHFVNEIEKLLKRSEYHV